MRRLPPRITRTDTLFTYTTRVRTAERSRLASVATVALKRPVGQQRLGRMVDDISAAARIGLRDIVDVAAIGTVLEEEVAREVGRAGGAATAAGLGQGLQTRRHTIDPSLDHVDAFAVAVPLQIGGNRSP